MLVQTFLVWAALTGAVFSLPLHAEETVVKGNEKASTVEWSKVEILRGDAVKRYSPPSWFARMANPSTEHALDPESFVFKLPEVSSSMGRPQRMGPKHACQRPNGTWVFCD